MKKKSYPVEKVYHLIEPGPVVMVTSSYNGKPNIMTMAWHMMAEFEPSLIACLIADDNYSFKAVAETRECVLNIPTVELAPRVVKVGSCSGDKVDKFKKFDFTPVPAEMVEPPLIAECYANIECKVVDMSWAKKYNIFMFEAVKAWITTSKKRQRTIHHYGNGIFIVDGKIIKLPWKKEMRRP
jgi:flavin reductase (DIM6/NTAB) family NADH-FMN oxidoreductase RutF